MIGTAGPEAGITVVPSIGMPATGALSVETAVTVVVPVAVKEKVPLIPMEGFQS